MKYLPPTGAYERLVFYARKHILIIATVALWILLTLFTIKYAHSSLNQNLSYETVLIAGDDIPKDSLLSQNQISTQKFLEGHLPQHAVAEAKKELLLGKRALVNIRAGDILTPSLLGETDSNIARLTQLIDKDKSIFTLSPKDVHMLSPLLEVGNRVALYIVDIKNDKKIKLLEHVRIIEVSRTGDKKTSGEISSVSLELGSDDITKVSEALAKEWFVELAIEAYQK
jgi:Flp pilus assembly protein CpaB